MQVEYFVIENWLQLGIMIKYHTVILCLLELLAVSVLLAIFWGKLVCA